MGDSSPPNDSISDGDEEVRKEVKEKKEQEERGRG